MAEFDAAEYEYLDETLSVVRKKLERTSREAEKSIGRLVEYNRYYWDNKASMDFTEKATHIADSEAYADVTNNSLREIRALQGALNSPYFGRITFVSDDIDEDIEDIYIGLTSVMDGTKFYVLDWRSPIASLFYNSKFGEVSYKAPMGEVKGILSGKRQYKISNGKLERVVDSELHLDDDSLQDALSRATTEKMRNIVNTIQEEQNEIIRNTKDRSIIVQGGAGSGKTSVALHRLAYLLYQDKDAKSSNMLIFSPNEVFSEYISSVLPQLGEENVLQTTFSDFASSFLTCFDKLETFSEFVSRCYDRDNMDEEKEKLIRFKFSDEYKKALDSYIKRVGKTFSFKDDVQVKNRTFSKDVLNRRFESYDNMSINDKLNELSREMCTALRLPYTTYGKTVKSSLKKTLTPTMNYRKFYNEFLASEEFVSAFGKKYKLKNNSFLEYPDILGMLYMHLELFGYPKNNAIRHLAIDEAQDYSPIQLEMIKKIFSGATFTVLGDVNQTINPYCKYGSLEEMTSILGRDTKYYELNKSYRSSPEITEYSNEILGLDNVESARTSSDIPVLVKEVPKESLFTELVRDISTMKENGLERIAIITRGDKEARALYEGLKDDVEGLSVISDDGKHYSSTAVVPSYISKGLEFDAVISYNDADSPYSEEDRYLYYVACTRAQHDLVVYNEPQAVKTKKLTSNDQ